MTRARNKPFILRFIYFILRLFLYFIFFSILWVFAYKYFPVPVTATMLMDDNGYTRDWVPLSEISVNVSRAVIAAEDSKFCTHEGFDGEAIEKALENNLKGKKLRGGSTISQQTAKNVFLWQNGGYFRKIFEAWFTLLIEKIWSKKRIIEVYLNVAETGIGTYGIEAGARRYYKKSAKQLTRKEAAKIAAALPLPKKRAVITPKGFTRRYGHIIAARITIVKNAQLDNCVFR